MVSLPSLDSVDENSVVHWRGGGFRMGLSAVGLTTPPPDFSSEAIMKLAIVDDCTCRKKSYWTRAIISLRLDLLGQYQSEISALQQAYVCRRSLRVQLRRPTQSKRSDILYFSGASYSSGVALGFLLA
ncbi:hypothetical protein I7I48_05583 [Histoplasma ohiense]|nr:hypothetical protein I7I48_05583 [Histoplasma ohiense (nom. inval.)]